MRLLLCVAAVAGLASSASCQAAPVEIVSLGSIGCDDLAATLMAEQALQDKVSGRDHNAMDRIAAYQRTAGVLACRPLNQGDRVQIVRDQDDMVCVHDLDQQRSGPNVPQCYWMRRRHIKAP